MDLRAGFRVRGDGIALDEHAAHELLRRLARERRVTAASLAGLWLHAFGRPWRGLGEAQLLRDVARAIARRRIEVALRPAVTLTEGDPAAPELPMLHAPPPEVAPPEGVDFEDRYEDNDPGAIEGRALFQSDEAPEIAGEVVFDDEPAAEITAEGTYDSDDVAELGGEATYSDGEAA